MKKYFFSLLLLFFSLSSTATHNPVNFTNVLSVTENVEFLLQDVSKLIQNFTLSTYKKIPLFVHLTF